MENDYTIIGDIRIPMDSVVYCNVKDNRYYFGGIEYVLWGEYFKNGEVVSILFECTSDSVDRDIDRTVEYFQSIYGDDVLAGGEAGDNIYLKKSIIKISHAYFSYDKKNHIYLDCGKYISTDYGMVPSMDRFNADYYLNYSNWSDTINIDTI